MRQCSQIRAFSVLQHNLFKTRTMSAGTEGTDRTAQMRSPIWAFFARYAIRAFFLSWVPHEFHLRMIGLRFCIQVSRPTNYKQLYLLEYILQVLYTDGCSSLPGKLLLPNPVLDLKILKGKPTLTKSVSVVKDLHKINYLIQLWSKSDKIWGCK